MLVFDLETQHTFDEVGGRAQVRRLRLAVGVTYDPRQDLYRVYTEDRVEALLGDLFAADRIIGYNLLAFDYEVLRAYTDRRLDLLPTVDMLVHLERALGWRPKLDDVVAATLGERKAGNGLDAVRWFRSGQLDRVIAYCKKDVEVTWKLYDFGRRNGYVRVFDRSWRPQSVPVRW